MIAASLDESGRVKPMLGDEALARLEQRLAWPRALVAFILLLVLNKADLLHNGEAGRLAAQHDGVAVSTVRRKGTRNVG